MRGSVGRGGALGLEGGQMGKGDGIWVWVSFFFIFV